MRLARPKSKERHPLMGQLRLGLPKFRSFGSIGTVCDNDLDWLPRQLTRPVPASSQRVTPLASQDEV